MKRISKPFIIALSSAALLLGSCTKDFVDHNTNPNASTVASPQSLLAPTLVTTINNNLNRNFRLNNEFMQVTVTTINSREFHRYIVRPSEADYSWRNWYRQLTNIRDIYNRAEEGQLAGFETFKGISRILDAWVGSMLTDMYGDVPYLGSNLGYLEQNITPEFDKQKDIYASIFDKLHEADTLLSKNINLPNDVVFSDPIYDGEALKWRKFGNALRLRLLMRVAHTGEFDAVAKIKEMVDIAPQDYPLFDNNEESATLIFSGENPFQNQFHNARDYDFNGDKGYSEFFINNFLELQDPRLPILATEATLGVYSGMQSGYAQGVIPQRESTLPLALKTDGRLGNILNYAEQQFLLAEAALNGYIQGNPTDYYNQGVVGAMDYWGVEEFQPEEYLLNPKANLDQAANYQDKLERIHLQKFYAMLFTDFQQWYEYRRTRALNLYQGNGLGNNGQMPSRLNYPILTRTFNYENYQKAVESMGGDSLNEKVWWEKN